MMSHIDCLWESSRPAMEKAQQSTVVTYSNVEQWPHDVWQTLVDSKQQWRPSACCRSWTGAVELNDEGSRTSECRASSWLTVAHSLNEDISQSTVVFVTTWLAISAVRWLLVTRRAQEESMHMTQKCLTSGGHGAASRSRKCKLQITICSSQWLTVWSEFINHADSVTVLLLLLLLMAYSSWALPCPPLIVRSPDWLPSSMQTRGWYSLWLQIRFNCM